MRLCALTSTRLLAGAVALCLLAGCSNVVDGSGRAAAGFGGSSAPPASSAPATNVPSGATGGGSGGAQATGCPTVQYPAAHLSYSCITDGMQPLNNSDPVWPVQQYKVVEPISKWAITEGARGPLTATTAQLAGLTTEFRGYSVSEDDYLPSPTVKTISSKDAVIDGAKAYVLESAITLDPAQAAKIGTKVKVEYRWDVAIQTDAAHVTVWYVSVPDLAKSLWPKVPAVINSIKVS